MNLGEACPGVQSCSEGRSRGGQQGPPGLLGEVLPALPPRPPPPVTNPSLHLRDLQLPGQGLFCPHLELDVSWVLRVLLSQRPKELSWQKADAEKAQ